MFVTATRNFVEEVDHGGVLIPVSSLNDTIALLSVVVKRKRLWLWQKPKYIPSDFKLNDILTGDAPIEPAVTETKFIKYSGTYGDNIQASIDANFGPGHVQSSLSLEGKDSSKLQSSFGGLMKEEVDMQKLLKDTKHRVLNMSHDLVRQTKEKPRQSFGIVKERIVTMQPCSVIEDVQLAGECGGGLSLCGLRSPKVLLKDNASLKKDCNVTMEIPVQTTIAYALTELEIKESGCFELCLMSYTTGGFEVDGPAQKELVGASGAPADIKNDQLRQELELLNKHFQLLSALPDTTRSTLLQQITEVMKDRGAVTSLQTVLDQMCLDGRSSLGDVTTDTKKQNIQAVVDLLEQSTPALTGLHLIASSMDEMTDECLAVLRMCCSSLVLPFLRKMVQGVVEETPVSSTALVALPEDVYKNIEHLFASSGVSMKRNGDTVTTEISPQAGNFPLILCVAVRGLASLALCD